LTSLINHRGFHFVVPPEAKSDFKIFAYTLPPPPKKKNPVSLSEWTTEEIYLLNFIMRTYCGRGGVAQMIEDEETLAKQQ